MDILELKAATKELNDQRKLLNQQLHKGLVGLDVIINKGYIQGPKPWEMKGRKARITDAYESQGNITLELMVFRKDGAGWLEGRYYCFIDDVDFK